METFGEIYDHIKNNTTLPKSDLYHIAYECYLRGMTKEQALREAQSLIG